MAIGWIHVRLTHVRARLPSIYFPLAGILPERLNMKKTKYTFTNTQPNSHKTEKTVAIQEIHLYQTADTGNIVLIYAILILDVLAKAWPATSGSRSFLAHPLEIPRYSPVQNRLSASAPLQHGKSAGRQKIFKSKLAFLKCGPFHQELVGAFGSFVKICQSLFNK